MWEEENTNVRDWKCIWNEKTNNLKSNLVYRWLYKNLMVTTHQKARIHTQNIKRNTNPIVKVVIKSQENIKGKKKKSYKNKSPILNKVAIKNIYINNSLKCKCIKCPNQWNRLVEWIQKQDPYIYCLQDLGTQMDWKLADGKGIPCRWKSKESWSSNIHMRQNRL